MIAGLSLLPASARRKALFEKAVRKVVGKKGEVNVVFVGRKEMLRLNKTFLNHSHDTDVIAFNYDEGDAFGDIYVSAHQARVQAKQLGHPVLREVLTLVVHGALHLVGYDDSTPRLKARMFKKQDLILANL